MAQFIAILTRAFYAEEVASSNASGAWYAVNYEVAEQGKLFESIPNNAPETEVTREVMAQIMYNLIRNKLLYTKVTGGKSWKEIQTVQNKIPDFADVSSSMEEAVSVCYAVGLIAGVRQFW